MRGYIRRLTLFMVAAALFALAVAVAMGGRNAVLIAQVLCAVEIGMVALTLAIFAVDS